MKRYVPSALIVIATVITTIIFYTILVSIGIPQNISVFIIFSFGSLVTLYPIIPLLVRAYYNSLEDEEGLSWVLQQSRLIRHAGTSEKHDRIRCTFHLSKNDLRDIYNMLIKYMDGNGINKNVVDVIIELRLKNKRRLVKSSLKEIFSIDNSDKNEIQHLKIELFNKNQPQSASISQISLEFLKESYAPIRYYILGNDETEVENISSTLEKMIRKRTRQTPTTTIGFFLLGLLAWIASEIYFLFILKPFHFTIIKIYGLLFGVVMILILVAAVACLFLFPRYNFYWNDYVTFLDRRHSVGKYILNNVFGVVIGILIGVLAGILANYYSATISFW